MTYLKYRWDENRGDEYSGWGASWWYFEFGSDGYPTRQVEVYDDGMRLRYGTDHTEDKYGRLSDAHETEMDGQAAEPLSADEFERVWQSVKLP